MTAFAVVPGAIIGALPPMVGWAAAGASVFSINAIIVAFFFFIWQVPHFWLLLLKYGKEYEKSGFPSLTAIFSHRQIRFTTFIWILATAITALMLPVFNIVQSEVISIGVILVSLHLIVGFIKLLNFQLTAFNPGKYFMKINYFVLYMIILLSVDFLF